MNDEIVGGYPLSSFVNPHEIPAEFKCSICMEVLNQPQQCRNGHCYCKCCIIAAVAVRPLCPICQTELDRNGYGLILRLSVHCRCLTNEICCEWIGQLVQLPQHYLNAHKDCDIIETVVKQVVASRRSEMNNSGGICFLEEGGNTYIGKLLDDKRHGYGISTDWESGATYNGEWVADLRDGYGVHAVPNSEVYRGQWSQGLMHGRGKMEEEDGTEYDGEWKEGVRCGQGTTTEANGDRHEGQYQDDIMHGLGTFYFTGGDTYTGNFENGIMHGQGKYTSTNIVYTGEFKDGEMTGEGLMTWRDGGREWCRGSFLRGQAHGKCEYQYADGGYFKGSYSMHLKDGLGHMTYPDGSTYTGPYVEGKREGHGRERFRNGNVYVGEFSGYKPMVKGTMTYPGGRSETRKWVNEAHGDEYDL